MEFKKIQINGFGNLINKEFELDNGINVIHGDNESGKSTLARFIKCMFYGINKNKAGHEYSEVELYKPWGNADFSGKIEYELDGEKYTTFREFNKNNCKVYDKDGKDISQDFNKDKARGSEIGLSHLGIDEETFINTIYVGQNDSPVELQTQRNVTQKLTNIMQSGQENISFEKIKAKLQKKALDEIGTDRTHNKPINIVRKEIAEKEQLRDKLLYNRDRKKVLLEKADRLQSQMKKTDEDIYQIDKVLDIKEKYVSLLEEKERIYDLTQKIKEKERKDKIENNKRQYKNALILLIIITLIACTAIAFFGEYIYILAEVILAIVGAVIVKKTNQISFEEQDDTDFDIMKEELNKKEIKELEKLREKGIKETYIDRKVNELRNLKSGLEKKKNDIELESHKNKIEEDSLKDNIERLTDVEEQLIDLKNKKENLEIRAKVIDVALNSLDKAYEEVRMKTIPELQKSIKEKIKITTNEKYSNAIYNHDEGILVENSIGEMIPINKLSIGTIDQMYLGFRFGIADKLNNIPVILDESFAYYDDVRLENILESLQNIQKQIIILTCSYREKKILDKLNLKYNFLEMGNSIV